VGLENTGKKLRCANSEGIYNLAARTVSLEALKMPLEVLVVDDRTFAVAVRVTPGSALWMSSMQLSPLSDLTLKEIGFDKSIKSVIVEPIKLVLNLDLFFLKAP
jgi:hypothetical protein